MKLLLFFLSFLLISCQLEPAGVVTVNTDAIFVIQAESDDGVVVQLDTGVKYGTGFFVEPLGKAYTAAHVVEDDDLNYFALLADGTRLPVRLMSLNVENDIAFIQVDPKDLGVFPYLDLSTSRSFASNDFFAYGASSGDYELLRMDGRLLDSSSFLIFDFHTPEGTSGGPIFNVDGEVVGVIHGYSKETHHGYGQPL